MSVPCRLCGNEISRDCPKCIRAFMDQLERHQASPQGQVEASVRSLYVAIKELSDMPDHVLFPEREDISEAFLALGNVVKRTLPKLAVVR